MNVPNHIAIILDGNGRWAKAKGMPRSYGHVKGYGSDSIDHVYGTEDADAGICTG